MAKNIWKHASQKQIEYLQNLVIFKVFRSEYEVRLRYEIMVWLKHHPKMAQSASWYISECLKLPSRGFGRTARAIRVLLRRPGARPSEMIFADRATMMIELRRIKRRFGRQAEQIELEIHEE